MRTNKLKIIIPLIILLVVAVGAGVFYFVNRKELIDIEISENPYGFEWGISMAEVEAQLSEKGLSKKLDSFQSSQTLSCTEFNFQNITGLDVRVVFLFGDSDQLRDVMYFFEYEDSEVDVSKEEMGLSYEAALDKCFGESVSVVEGEGEYWIGEKALISMLGDYSEKSSVSVCFSDANAYMELVEALKALKE